MKTNYFKILSLAFAATLMASCSQDENTMPTQPEEDEIRSITAVSTGFNDVDAGSRAITDTDYATAFEEGDRMGLYAVSADKVILNNIPLTYTAGSWTSDRRIYYYEGADYIAYYPYTNIATPTAGEGQTLTAAVEAAIKNANELPMVQNSKDIYEKADLMMAKKTAAEVAVNKTLNFTLLHQHALIEFVLPAHRMKYPKAGKTAASQDAADFIEFTVPMTEFKLTSVGTSATSGDIIPYAVGDGRTFRLLVPVGTVPQFAAKFSDPKDNMPVTIANATEATALTAGNYKQYKVTKVMVDDVAVDYPETAQPIDIVGSYLCNDGSILPYSWAQGGADASNAVAIIIGQTGTDDFTGTDIATKGFNYYAMAIKEVNATGFDKEGDGTFNLDGVFQLTDDDTSTNFHSKQDMSGYASTQKLLALNAGGTIKTRLSTFQVPANIDNSGWFVGSVGQWLKVMEAANAGAPVSQGTQGWGTNTDVVYTFMKERIGMVSSTWAAQMEGGYSRTYWTLTRCSEGTGKIHSAAWNSGKFLIGVVSIDAPSNLRYIRPIIAF